MLCCVLRVFFSLKCRQNIVFFLLIMSVYAKIIEVEYIDVNVNSCLCAFKVTAETPTILY